MAVSTIIRRNRVSSEIGFQSLTACTSSWKSENRKVSPNSNSSRREAGRVKKSDTVQSGGSLKGAATLIFVTEMETKCYKD